jgi:hypothetical protein
LTSSPSAADTPKGGMHSTKQDHSIAVYSAKPFFLVLFSNTWEIKVYLTYSNELIYPKYDFREK